MEALNQGSALCVLHRDGDSTDFMRQRQYVEIVVIRGVGILIRILFVIKIILHAQLKYTSGSDTVFALDL